MKRIIIAGLLISGLLGNSLEDRVKILEQRVTKLEQKLNIVNTTQNKIKKNISQTTILKCNKLKFVHYSFDLDNNGFTKSYHFKYTLKNNYKKTIKYIYATIGFVEKKSESKLLEDYIKRDVVLSPNQSKVINTNYLIDDSLSEELSNTSKNNIRIDFEPIKIKFTDGSVLKCIN